MRTGRRSQRQETDVGSIGGGIRVPFLDLRAIHAPLEAEFHNALSRVLSSGRYLLGVELEAFEAEFAEFAGATACVGVGSGLDALTLSLRALGIGPGDDVGVPTNTFIATWLAVTAVGATPVPIEPDPATYNITAAAVEAAGTTRMRAVIPVHLYGQPVLADPLVETARRHDLIVVVDAAQAHGARIAGHPIGGLGAASTWSFYPGKNLGALGDAGAITTNDLELADRLRMLRNYGSTEKYVHPLAGVNSRLDEIQAALLRIKLGHLPRWTERRCHQADRYLERLQGIDELTLPVVPPGVDPVWHLFVVRTADRDRLRKHLADSGIETLVHYPIPPYRQGAFAGYDGVGQLELSDRLHAEVLSLPVGPHLTDSQVDHVATTITRYFDQ